MTKKNDKNGFFFSLLSAPVPAAMVIYKRHIPLHLLLSTAASSHFHTLIYILCYYSSFSCLSPCCPSLLYYCTQARCHASSSSFALTVLILWNKFLVNLITIFINFQYIIGRLLHRNGCIHAGHRDVTMRGWQIFRWRWLRWRLRFNIWDYKLCTGIKKERAWGNCWKYSVMSQSLTCTRGTLIALFYVVFFLSTYIRHEAIGFNFPTEWSWIY